MRNWNTLPSARSFYPPSSYLIWVGAALVLLSICACCFCYVADPLALSLQSWWEDIQERTVSRKDRVSDKKVQITWACSIMSGVSTNTTNHDYFRTSEERGKPVMGEVFSSASLGVHAVRPSTCRSSICEGKQAKVWIRVLVGDLTRDFSSRRSTSFWIFEVTWGHDTLDTIAETLLA